MSYFQPYSASRAKEEGEAKAMPQAVEEGEVVVEGVVHSFDAIEGPAGDDKARPHGVLSREFWTAKRIGVLAIIALLLAGIGVILGMMLPRDLSFSLKGTSRLAFRYQGLSSLLNPGGSQQAQFEAHIRIDNPNHFPITIDQLDLDIYDVNKAKIGVMSLAAAWKVKPRSKDTFTAQVSLSIPNRELLVMASDCLDGDDHTSVTVVGTANGVRAAGGLYNRKAYPVKTTTPVACIPQ